MSSLWRKTEDLYCEGCREVKRLQLAAGSCCQMKLTQVR